MGKYFGTDGFRGRVNETLTARHAYEIGRYIGYYTRAKKRGARARVAIGKDPRRSSYMYEYALAAGITASGVDAYLLHVTTTPSVSYVTRTEGFDLGVMISASHNPWQDNGIKLFGALGEKANDDLILGVERHLDGVASAQGEQLPYAVAEDVGRTVDFSMGRNRYIGFLISLSKTSFEGLKIGLDCADGATFFIAKSVFDALGAQTRVIHAAPDGENINRVCGSTCPLGLAKLVKEEKLDMGFAFDGDGDRCICVDERGEIADGDHILYALAKDIYRGISGSVALTAMSNSGLIQSLKTLNISAEITPVGDKYVYERMKQKGLALGGEQSGHIILSRYGTAGDGIVTAIKMAELALSSKQPFSRLFDGLEIYPQAQKNVAVKNKNAVLSVPAVQAAIARAEESLSNCGGRLLVRVSGTEERVRVLAEGKDGELCSRLAYDLQREIMRADAEI